MSTVNLTEFVQEHTGRPIYIPGYATAECVALFWAYNTECCSAEAYSAPGANDLWDLDWDTYTKHLDIANAQDGDVGIWSGTTGAYTNDGAGHVAIFYQGLWFSQNPNPPALLDLDPAGLRGLLRPDTVALAPAASTITPIPAQQEDGMAGVTDDDLQKIYNAVWFGVPGAPLIQNRRQGQPPAWPETYLGSLEARIRDEILPPALSSIIAALDPKALADAIPKEIAAQVIAELQAK